MKRKIIISLSIFILILSITGTSYWQIKEKNRSSADIIPIYNPEITRILTTKSKLFASACTDPIECEGTTDQAIFFFDPLHLFAQQSNEAADSIFVGCVRELTVDPKNIPTTPVVAGSCTFQFLGEPSDGSYPVNAKVSVLGHPQGDFSTTFSNSKREASSNDKADIQFDAVVEYNRYIRLNSEPGQSIWTDSNDGFEGFVSNQGSANVRFTFDMTDSSSYPKDTILDYKSDPDIVIDKQNSDWFYETEGEVYGYVKGSWNVQEDIMDYNPSFYKTEKLDFCNDDPNTTSVEQCKINLKETLKLKAKKLGTTDHLSGDIEISQIREAKYIGNGYGNAATKKVYWSSFIVDNNDLRTLKNTFTFNNKPVTYFEEFKAKSLEYPMDLIYNVDSTVKMNASFPPMNSGMTGMPNQPPTNLDMAIVDYQELNYSGNFNRTGTGSYKENGAETKGVYDKIDSKMKITSPQSKLGQRIDPAEKIPAYLKKHYLPDIVFNVPGKFSATNYTSQAIQGMSSRPYTGIPDDIYVFWSFETKPRDKVFPKTMTDKVEALLKELEENGAQVHYVSTETISSLKNAFANLPNDVWVVNLGHGSPNGLRVGDGNMDDDSTKVNPDEGVLSYQEIDHILKDKQIQINTFAGVTCFAGRAPIAQRVIGCLTPAAEGPSGLLNSLGFGDKSWTYSTTDIIAEIRRITGCTQQ